VRLFARRFSYICGNCSWSLRVVDTIVRQLQESIITSRVLPLCIFPPDLLIATTPRHISSALESGLSHSKIPHYLPIHVRTAATARYMTVTLLHLLAPITHNALTTSLCARPASARTSITREIDRPHRRSCGGGAAMDIHRR
jgi:hypothetical protein